MEGDLAVVIGVGVRIIQCGVGKPLPSSIINEALALGITFVVSPEVVPTLVAVICWDVEIQNLEDIPILQISVVAVIRVGILWRDVAGLEV